MSYRNAIADIPARSTWIAKDGTRALVVQAAAAHVTFTRISPIVPRPLLTPAQTLHEREFRARFKPLYDRAAIRSQFSMTLANLGAFTAFWLGHPDRFVARSVSCTRRFRIPEGARRIGTYEAPFSPDAFLEDLDDLLARLDRDARQAAAAGS